MSLTEAIHDLAVDALDYSCSKQEKSVVIVWVDLVLVETDGLT